MTVARAHSATLVGLDAHAVIVETAIGAGLPGLTIVGLPDAAVRETKERIRSALRQIGFPLPGRNVIVNLAPADLPKTGAALDLAIALSILAATGDLSPDALDGAVLVGELALDGEVRAVPGTLSVAEMARRDRMTTPFLPHSTAAEAAAFTEL